MSALFTWPWLIWVRNWPKSGFFVSPLGLIRRWAKNANTTTMRIGKAALLKNLLMTYPERGLRRCGKRRAGFSSLPRAIRPPGTSAAPWSAAEHRFYAGSSHPPLRSRRRNGWARGRDQRGHVREVAIALLVIEAIADGEPVRNLEADVTRGQLDLAPFGFGQQGADLQRRRVAGAEAAQQVLEREPRVHDVLDDEHVSTLDRGVEVLEDPHHARGVGGRAVGGDGHEVHLARDLDVAHEIRQKEHRSLEHADQHQVAALVVARDLGAELPHAVLEVVGLHEDLADRRVAHVGQASGCQRPNSRGDQPAIGSRSRLRDT